MRIHPDDADAEFSFLAVNGKALTYDTAIFPTQLVTGPLSASNMTDPVSSRTAKELVLNFTVVPATSGTLTATFLALDPMEPSNGVTGVATGTPPAVLSIPLSGGAPISGPSTLRFVIAEGEASAWLNGKLTSLGQLNVPMLWQVMLQVSGTVSVLGTFEARS